MTAAAADLRVAFPEFDQATYPDAMVNFWLTDGYAFLNACRLGARIDLAAMLYAAHSLTLGQREMIAATAGAIVGEVKGPTASKSVDKASVNYSPDLATSAGGEAWNLTSYGVRLAQLLKRANLGGFYVRGRRRRFDPPIFGRMTT
jgi:hypothetical protein